MQSANAQENTQHSAETQSHDPHSATTNSSHSSESHSTEAAGDASHSAEGAASTTHSADASHGNAMGSEHGSGDASHGTAMSTEHSSGDTTHSATTEHGAAGSEHAAGGGHGEGHAVAYHPPAHYLMPIGNTTFHLNTVLGTWFAMAFIIVLALMASKKLQKKPDSKQTFFESVVDLVNGIVASQVKHDTYKYVPLVGSIFVFVICANWMGLLPWRVLELFGTHHDKAGNLFEIASPTNDLNTTGALAIISVISYYYFGLRKKGLGHFKHYLQPMPFMLPLNMLEDITRPLSLSFRLFGNMIGGEIVIGILVFLTAPTIIGGVVALPIMVMELLVGFIQAFIFAMLTSCYIGAVVAEHH